WCATSTHRVEPWMVARSRYVGSSPSIGNHRSHIAYIDQREATGILLPTKRDQHAASVRIDLVFGSLKCEVCPVIFRHGWGDGMIVHTSDPPTRTRTG